MFYPLYKKGVLGVQHFCLHKSSVVFGHFGHQNGWFFKLEHFLRPFFRTWSHDGSAHTFRSRSKKGFYKKNCVAIFFTKVGGLISPTKTQFKNIKFDMVVNWHKQFCCRYKEFFLKLKKGFRGSLRSDFYKTIYQSNVNGFSWNIFH